jgi:hypothetical protein
MAVDDLGNRIVNLIREWIGMSTRNARSYPDRLMPQYPTKTVRCDNCGDFFASSVTTQRLVWRTQHKNGTGHENFSVE